MAAIPFMPQLTTGFHFNFPFGFKMICQINTIEHRLNMLILSESSRNWMNKCVWPICYLLDVKRQRPMIIIFNKQLNIHGMVLNAI